MRNFCLAAKEHADGRREDDDVGDVVVVASEVNGGAGEVFLAGVAVDGEVLTEEAAGDEGLMANLDMDAAGREVDEEAVVDANPGGLDDEDAAAPQGPVEKNVEEGDVLVEDVGLAGEGGSIIRLVVRLGRPELYKMSVTREVFCCSKCSFLDLRQRF